jgi:hypothetical protein
MKRLTLYLIIALLTFTIGSTLSILRTTHKLTASELKTCIIEADACVDRELGRSLMSIDEQYGARCRTYNEDQERLRTCLDEWDRVRDDAIVAVVQGK